MTLALAEAAAEALVQVAVARRELFLAPLRSRMARVAGVHFDNQRIVLERKLRERGAHLNESVCREGLGDAVAGLMITIFDEFAVDTADAMREILMKAMEGAIKHRLLDFGYAMSFSLRNPAAQRYLKTYCLNEIKKIDATTLKIMKGIVYQGLYEGASYTEIAARMVSRYAAFGTPVPQHHLRNRAELIATYETGQAYEAASREVADTIAKKGIPIEKSSITVGDDRVDAECLAKEAQKWIPLDQPFTTHLQKDNVEHQRSPFHIACRCTTIYRVATKRARAMLARSPNPAPVEFYAIIK